MKFPAPPWQGTNRLIPLTNFPQIAACAKEFNNCLVGEVLNILGGRRYFYLWGEGRGVVVALENDRFLGWVIGEIKARKNRNVPRKVVQEIKSDASSSGYIMLKDYDEACNNLWHYRYF